MTKREACRTKLEPLLADRAKLERLLLRDSGLPGRRANIELAAAFADVFEDEGEVSDTQWEMLVKWASLSHDEAPTNSKREFLPFCAVQALGALYVDSDGARREAILSVTRAASRSGRWRTREAAVFALQRIGGRGFAELREIVTNWLDRANRMERRAIVAALAYPPLLEGPDGEAAVAFALEVSGRILRDIRKLPKTGRATEEFRVLAKGLGYALSVFAAAAPEDGFRFLRRWAEADDTDVKKIVAANIRKARLAKRFPDECAEVGEILSWS